jgi:Antitoxin of toxin-antitoxin, RelE / RelB, TA system
MHEITASQARNQFADVYESALAHLPTSISRRRGGSAVMVDGGDFDALLRAFEFSPEVFFEQGAVSIWLPELKIWGRGDTFALAQADLLDEVDELIALIESDSAMRAAPETVEQLPWVYRLMRTSSDEARMALLFAPPQTNQPRPALAGMR